MLPFLLQTVLILSSLDNCHCYRDQSETADQRASRRCCVSPVCRRRSVWRRTFFSCLGGAGEHARLPPFWLSEVRRLGLGYRRHTPLVSADVHSPPPGLHKGAAAATPERATASSDLATGRGLGSSLQAGEARRATKFIWLDGLQAWRAPELVRRPRQQPGSLGVGWRLAVHSLAIKAIPSSPGAT